MHIERKRKRPKRRRVDRIEKDVKKAGENKEEPWRQSTVEL